MESEWHDDAYVNSNKTKHVMLDIAFSITRATHEVETWETGENN